jgi:hypothetical protein
MSYCMFDEFLHVYSEISASCVFLNFLTFISDEFKRYTPPQRRFSQPAQRLQSQPSIQLSPQRRNSHFRR